MPPPTIARVRPNLKRPPEVNEALSGTWLGHPVHPLLIMLPMGTWTSAVLLDWLGGDDAETAADVLLGAGLAAAVPTVATGYADWADTEPASDTVRRLGIVHAACNGTAAVLFAASLAARAAGARGRGKLLALGGRGRSRPAATSAATSPTPRASASTTTRSSAIRRTGRRRWPTPPWARAR